MPGLAPDPAPNSAPDSAPASATARTAEILARGARRGMALEPFGPIWTSAKLRLARASWGCADVNVFAQLDVPYTGTSSGRLSEDAVHVVLAAWRGDTPLRVMELGAGSGIFARLFLDALARIAPDVYRSAHYVVTDGSAALLAAQAREGVLDAHRDRVEWRRLDLTGDWGDLGAFDAILGTYILDSLPFDLLALRDDAVWRRETRSVLDNLPAEAEALRAALAEDADLTPFLHLAPLIGLQTRHVPVARTDQPWFDTLPTDSDGEVVPYLHCHGALDCLHQSLARLRPGGVLVFSDYGHLDPFGAHDLVTFQSYGEAASIGLNFPQIESALAMWGDVAVYKPEGSSGNLHTRVVQRRDAPDLPDLSEVVEDRYGVVRLHALTAPCEVAREFLRARMFETARGIYAKALRLEPFNWALIQEIASMLAGSGDARAAADMAAEGLRLNPLSAELWRIKGVAHLDLHEGPEAHAALTRTTTLAPGSPNGWAALARLEISEGRIRPALLALAEALAADREGELRNDLLAIQERALTTLAEAQWKKLIVTANQFRPLDDGPDETEDLR